MALQLIFAYEPNRNAFGYQNKLPWPKVTQDLQAFKDITNHAVVIMGRHTWESLPFKLPNRTNIVISSNPAAVMPKKGLMPDNIFPSLDNALEHYESMEVFVIGGPSLLEQAMDRATSVYVTQIYGEFKADVFLSDNFLRKLEQQFELKHVIESIDNPVDGVDMYRIFILKRYAPPSVVREEYDSDS